MSTADSPSPPPAGDRQQSSPAAGTAGPRRAAGQPPRRSGGTQALALLLALLAILGAGYVGWRQWQLAQGSAVGNASVATLQQRVAALESELRASDSTHADLQQSVQRMAQRDDALSAQLPALDERTRHLEDAVAVLAERTQAGREPILLDETESLLRMAAERYRLFHDAEGAEDAYQLADQTLAAVGDGTFVPVRQAIRAERDALARSHPQHQAQALQQLQALRASVPGLPLEPVDRPDTTNDGVWARIGRALGGVIRVQRDNGGPLALQDARFVRELTVLDLAQAQAALLAHDDKAYADALQRADASLATQFDQEAPAVQQAHALLRQLATETQGGPVQLGAALTELRNLRAVRALRPTTDSSAPGAPPGAAPAAAASSGPAHGTASGGSHP